MESSTEVGSSNRLTLLVEPDEMMRWALQHALLDLGHGVLCARHGQEALQLAWEPSAPIRILITEAILPDLPGREVVRLLRTRTPMLAVLFTGWQPDDELRRDFPFLRKPFHLADFRSMVGSLGPSA